MAYILYIYITYIIYIVMDKVKSERKTNIEKVKLMQNESHRVNSYFAKQIFRHFSLRVCVYLHVCVKIIWKY